MKNIALLITLCAQLYSRICNWIIYDFLGIIKEFRLSYLPPLMVYLAAGISGFTGIIESFYVKQELGLSAAFLASLGFWAGLPWALKMPLGHLVDLYWRAKAVFVYLGAVLMTLSLTIMIGLTGYPEQMIGYMRAETWYVISTLLSPIGFILQDVVADAMTVEAVPHYDEQANPINEQELKRMHITMQTLGRIAIIGGSAMVAGIGGWLATHLSYTVMYKISLLIPVVSVCGVLLGQLNNRHREQKLRQRGITEVDIRKTLPQNPHKPSPNWYILSGSTLFIILSLTLGLSDFSLKKEAIFISSLGIVIYLMRLILAELHPQRRTEIIGIAIIIFVFRAMPGVGAGSSWWQIDALGFDEAFFGTLRQIASILVIIGLFALRSWMTRKPIPYLIIFLSVYSAVMMLPFIGMFYGLHLWTEAHFGFGARTIAIVDTMADSPLGQVAMVPMLAWIAREAPAHQKATYFAIMAAFTNLALSAANLGTNYMNKLFFVERGNYTELGALFITTTLLGLIVPTGAVIIVNYWTKKQRSEPS